MPLVLTEMNHQREEIQESKPDPTGVVLVDQFGKWEIARRDGIRLSGNGPIIGLKRSSAWLSNLSFEESRSIFSSDEHRQIVRGGNWLLYGLDEIMREWGYAKFDIKNSAGFLSTITGRMTDIVEGIIRGQGTKGAEKKLREICRSASLATGLMSMMETAVRKTVPSDEKVRDHLEKTYQNGMFYRKDHVNDSEIILDFRFPRMSYSLSLASVKVPTDSSWQKATRPDNISYNDFVAEVVQLGRPAIFRGMFDYDHETQPRWLGALIGNREGTERSRFLVDEILGVPDIDRNIESALISKGGDVASVTSGMLNNIIKDFGGESAASLSWTAGLVAENIMAAPHRAGRTSQAAVSAEQVWLAARDRMKMAPLMASLTESGCLVHNARGGRVTVMAPRAPEVILAAVSLAWEHGAYLPIGQAMEVKKLFETDMPTERSTFLGSDADYLVSVANHKGDRKTLWGLDAICDAPDAQARKEMADAVLNG